MNDRLWTFNTARFQVCLIAEYDSDPDLSWRDAAQIAYDESHGVEYYSFSVIVRMDGREIARDTLGGSGYSDPREFATEHRDSNPMNRNCSVMRNAKGHNVSICHYFPDLVSVAIAKARRELAIAVPRMRKTGQRGF